MLFFLHRRRLFLWNMESQDAVLVLGVDIFLSHMGSHIEAAAHAPGIAFPPYIIAVLVLFVPVQALFRADSQCAVVKPHPNLVLFIAGQVNIHHITVLRLLDIGFHQVFGVLAIQSPVDLRESQFPHKTVKQILSENTGHHHKS